jgi:hypothetical protein
MAEDPKPVLVELEHVYPPIPNRGMDWAATLKEYYDPENGDPVGRGATPGEAISDLFEQVFDDFPKLEGNHSEMLEAILIDHMREAIKHRVESWKYSDREAYCFEAGFKACMSEIFSLLE